MAYSKQTWSTGDPITQEKMNHIEDGIADAHSAASAATSDVSDLSSSITTLTSDMTTAKSNIR